MTGRRAGRAVAGLAWGCLLACLPPVLARAGGGDQRLVVILLAGLAPLAVIPLAVATLLLGWLALRPAGQQPVQEPAGQQRVQEPAGQQRVQEPAGQQRVQESRDSDDDRRPSTRGPRRPWPRRVGAVLAAALLITDLFWVLPSLLPDRQPAATGAITVRLLAVNLEVGGADATDLVRIVRDRRVDVLVTPELTPGAVARLRAAGLDQLLPNSVLQARDGVHGTGIWTRLPVTPLQPVPGTGFVMPRARLGLPGGLPGGRTFELTAVHTSAPLSIGPAAWRQDLRLLGLAISSVPGPQVVAGDFNATRDHAPFRHLLDTGLVDAADVKGLPAWPGWTWPSPASANPDWLQTFWAKSRWPGRPSVVKGMVKDLARPAMRLDHVLVSPDQIVVRSVRTLTVADTDHRGVLAELALPAPPAPVGSVNGRGGT